MKKLRIKIQKRKKRKKRTRAKIFGTAGRPRLSVYRSNKAIYAQLIDDEKGETLVSAATRELGKIATKTKTQQATILGELIADKAKAKGITKVVFDRGCYKFHGRVKAVAEGARKEGLQF